MDCKIIKFLQSTLELKELEILHFIILIILGFTLHEAELQLREMELQEKEEEKFCRQRIQGSSYRWKETANKDIFKTSQNRDKL